MFPCQANSEVQTAKCEHKRSFLIDFNENVSLPSEVRRAKCELANKSIQDPKLCILQVDL